MKLAAFAALLFAAYLVTGLLAFFSLDRLTYYPRRGLDAGPTDFGLHAEEVSFSASDGTALHGWYFPRSGSRAVLVFLHGNAGNISHRLASVHQLLRAPADVFLFDYRGYGLSAGEPKGEKPLLDARAAVEAVRARPGVADKKIVLLGESIGGTMALITAASAEIDGVITMAAFSSVRRVARSMPAYWLFSFFVPDRFNALEAVSRVSAPLLFIHGTADEIIPFNHGEQLFAAARAEKEHLWVKGGMHNDLFAVAGPEIVSRITSFLKNL